MWGGGGGGGVSDKEYIEALSYNVHPRTGVQRVYLTASMPLVQIAGDMKRELLQ